jgi:hypothetical protein
MHLSIKYCKKEIQAFTVTVKKKILAARKSSWSALIPVGREISITAWEEPDEDSPLLGL